jgi:hypothetical protein
VTVGAEIIVDVSADVDAFRPVAHDVCLCQNELRSRIEKSKRILTACGVELSLLYRFEVMA